MAGLKGMAKRVGVDKWMFFTTLLLSWSGWRWSSPPRPWWLRTAITPPTLLSASRLSGPWPVCWPCCCSSHVDYTLYNSPRFIYPALCVTTLLLVVVFFIPGSHNTHRWIRFGGFFTFQPSEIAKPVLVLFLAWFLHTRLDQMRDWKHTLLRAAVMPAGLHRAGGSPARSGHGAGAGRRHRHDAGAGWHGMEVPVHRLLPRRCPCSPGYFSRLVSAASACWSFSIPTTTRRASASTSTSR